MNAAVTVVALGALLLLLAGDRISQHRARARIRSDQEDR